MILQQQLLNLSDVSFLLRLRGDQFWVHLEHISTLHETVQSSEKCWIMSVFNFLRLHVTFQQLLLQFYRL
jgi:hypothetical protein